MMVQEHISLRQLLLREEDVLPWYSMPIRQTSSLKRTNPDASRTEANDVVNQARVIFRSQTLDESRRFFHRLRFPEQRAFP